MSAHSIIRGFCKPSFLICTIILIISATGMSFAIRKFGVYLQKEPVDLKKPLDQLDEHRLASYTVVDKQIIENPEILKSLGTEDYIEWILEDTNSPSDSPVRYCSLFITYYGLPDRVPHVPEECYTGSGHQKLASESVELEITLQDRIQLIPIRYLIFAGTDENHWRSTKFPVFYFFYVNDKFANSRDEARVALNTNIFGKSSYFSKVEWKFFNYKYGNRVYPIPNESIEASQKLLTCILPVLIDEHWPTLSDRPNEEAVNEAKIP